MVLECSQNVIMGASEAYLNVSRDLKGNLMVRGNIILVEVQEKRKQIS